MSKVKWAMATLTVAWLALMAFATLRQSGRPTPAPVVATAKAPTPMANMAASMASVSSPEIERAAKQFSPEKYSASNP